MPLRYPAERILIRCPNWIGDAVAATAAVRRMRMSYPQAHIGLLLTPYVAGVYENGPWHNEVVEFDRRRGGLGEILRVGKRLRRRPRYDLAVLLTHSFSSALAIWLGRAGRRVGHARNGRSRLLTDAIPWPRRRGDTEVHLIPKVQLYRSLLDYLGSEAGDDQRPELFTSAQDEARCDELFKIHNRDSARPAVALAPGAAYGSSKLWPPQRFAAVGDRLAREKGFQPIILTGPGEAGVGMEIARAMKETPIAFREGELTFGALKAMVRRCGLMVCNDSGPRHVAIAYNVPVVVIMGPTDPAATHSDYGRTFILRQDVPCGPCYLRTCSTDHQCMKRVTPEMVMDAAEELLGRTN